MIAVIDYGRGNLGSVEKAFGRVGIPAGVTPDPGTVDGAGAYFYFVHSYYPVVATAASSAQIEGGLRQAHGAPGRPILRVAWCEYGIEFAAAIERGLIYATQFHPEKSQRWGLRLLENFAAIVKGGAR